MLYFLYLSVCLRYSSLKKRNIVTKGFIKATEKGKQTNESVFGVIVPLGELRCLEEWPWGQM
jgi:hypothetical protein